MTDSARAKALLQEIAQACERILSEGFVGVYVHGSLAFGCFSWATGDIDFLIVVQHDLTQQQKERLIAFLLEAEKRAPKKGFEMSVMLLADCLRFRHPSPYVLHYSGAYRAAYEKDLSGCCAKMQGTDADLAAHCTVMRAVGYKVCGKEIADVFGPVPRRAYVDSLLYDVENAREEITDNPVYVTLNLCRVLAYLREGCVISKRDGGAWGLEHVSNAYAAMIQNALDAYAGQRVFDQPLTTARDFAAYMLGLINDAK
ncbi:MAG: DUF4111 domain-containing protein [Clostridia bacterium]|nr:DUF4111 domain-containing protein [Clostridia bacterium]